MRTLEENGSQQSREKRSSFFHLGDQAAGEREVAKQGKFHHRCSVPLLLLSHDIQ
jgi:hypothetical protein